MSNLSDLRQSTNETARVARANLLLLLTVGLFIGILVSATSDMMLLKGVHMDLPLMDVEVPIDHFYAMAPIVFVVLHLHLFLRLNRLAHVAGLLQAEIEKRETPAEKTVETALLYPFDFLQVILYRTGRQAEIDPPGFRQIVRYFKYEHERYGYLSSLVVIVALSIFVLPAAILVWMQMTFLSYQNEFITFIHQSVISIDLAAQLFFIYRIGVFGKLLAVVREGPTQLERVVGLANFGFISVPVVALLAISWVIAVVPDSWLERNLPFPEARSSATYAVFKDWWFLDGCDRRSRPGHRTLRRYIHMPGKAIASELQLVHGGVHSQGSPEQNLVRGSEIELDLSRRSLRYAWLDRSRFPPTTFAGSDLHCSKLRETKLQGAVFDGAELNGAVFDDADLRKASFKDVTSSGTKFEKSDMRDVVLSGSEFRDGSFRGARMEGAVARNVDFYGTDLKQTKFHGADMSNVDFFGGDLDRAEFHGADLDGAEFHGTTLRNAEIYGVILEDAEFRATNANGAKFYGTSLRRADVTETSLFEARFFGNDMRSIKLQYSNLRKVRLGEPGNWASFILKIDEALERRGLDAEERKMMLDDIKEDASEEYHSRGLEGLEAMKCTWTDGSGPFNEWSAPEPTCGHKLEEYLVNEACNSGVQGVAAGIAEVVGSPETWQEAVSALGLLETGTDECDAITEMHRSKICEGLIDWFDKDEEEDDSSDAVPPIVQSTLMDRWNRARETGLCSTTESR